VPGSVALAAQGRDGPTYAKWKCVPALMRVAEPGARLRSAM